MWYVFVLPSLEYSQFLGQIVNGKVKKLETSDTIYHRILWDPAFNAEDYIIGYLDRFVGMLKLMLLIDCLIIFLDFLLFYF
jgi:predicted permease